MRVPPLSAAVDDALAVRRALANMDARITEIGRALGLSGDRVDTIKRLHGSVGGRCAVAIIDTWLRGDYNHERDPYTASGVRDPTWWSLVWAVAHRVGGKNAAEARAIAEKHNSEFSHLITVLVILSLNLSQQLSVILTQNPSSKMLT